MCLSSKRSRKSAILIHCDLVTPYGNMDLGQHWLIQSHYLNQCRHIVSKSMLEYPVRIWRLKKNKTGNCISKSHPDFPVTSELKMAVPWWRHQMETFSALLALCAVPVNSPHKGPVTRSFDVFFDLRPNKRLSKQPWGWWFETPSWSLWRQCNA